MKVSFTSLLWDVRGSYVDSLGEALAIYRADTGSESSEALRSGSATFEGLYHMLVSPSILSEAGEDNGWGLYLVS